jgi:uncharacterized protein
VTALKSIIAVALFVMLNVPARAQDESVSIGVRLKVHSAILNQDRVVLVSTPPNYERSGIRYPVVYVLDGSSLFLQTVSDTRFLASAGKAPGSIVVAIVNTDRTRDYTPETAIAEERQNNPTCGGADAFRRFLVGELRPFIENRYRTEPFSVIVGWSFGGLFAMHSLLLDPESFDAYIAVSPSLQWDDERLVTRAKRIFTPDARLKKFLYLTHARENNFIPASVEAFAAVLGRQAPADLRWKFEYLPGDNHVSTPLRAIYGGLEWLFADWAFPEDGIPEVADVERRFARLTEEYGFTCRPDEERINGMAYALLSGGDTAKAVAMFEYNVRLFPESPNVYDSLADGLEAAGRPALALENCRTACRLAEKSADPGLEVFRKHLERLSGKAPAR